jgi:hypothetical protein
MRKEKITKKYTSHNNCQAPLIGATANSSIEEDFASIIYVIVFFCGVGGDGGVWAKPVMIKSQI